VKLRPAQQIEITQKYGVCVNEACDACGKALGAVRYTNAGALGAWCSELCRDGQTVRDARQQRRQAKTAAYDRRVLLSRKHHTAGQRAAARREATRARMKRLRQRKTALQVSA
jgi:hypothetical protein